MAFCIEIVKGSCDESYLSDLEDTVFEETRQFFSDSDDSSKYLSYDEREGNFKCSKYDTMNKHSGTLLDWVRRTCSFVGEIS